jgi:hypothetical protein
MSIRQLRQLGEHAKANEISEYKHKMYITF